MLRIHWQYKSLFWFSWNLVCKSMFWEDAALNIITCLAWANEIFAWVLPAPTLPDFYSNMCSWCYNIYKFIFWSHFPYKQYSTIGTYTCHGTCVNNRIKCDLVEVEMTCNVSVQDSPRWPSGPARGCWTRRAGVASAQGVLPAVCRKQQLPCPFHHLLQIPVEWRRPSRLLGHTVHRRGASLAHVYGSWLSTGETVFFNFISL